MEIKIQFPYVDDFGVSRPNLIKHWAEDENGNFGKILQVETGLVYDVAIDVYPCKYTYTIYHENNEELQQEIVEE